MERTRILLADDHDLMLDGLTNLLEPRYDVVGTASDGNVLLELARLLKPDLIMLDITMPLLNGIDAAKVLRKYLPKVKLLFVTMHSNPAYLSAALRAGADGYALKSAGRGEILSAVDQVLTGKRYISPDLGSGLAQTENPDRAAAALRLTPREKQILKLLAEGKARKEKAHILGISEKTVAFHKNNIKRKLGIQTTAQLTRYAMESGLV